MDGRTDGQPIDNMLPRNVSGSMKNIWMLVPLETLPCNEKYCHLGSMGKEFVSSWSILILLSV
jgi:hypothetical protein